MMRPVVAVVRDGGWGDDEEVGEEAEEEEADLTR